MNCMNEAVNTTQPKTDFKRHVYILKTLKQNSLYETKLANYQSAKIKRIKEIMTEIYYDCMVKYTSLSNKNNNKSYGTLHNPFFSSMF